MSEQIVLTLPSDILADVKAEARMRMQAVEDVLISRISRQSRQRSAPCFSIDPQQNEMMVQRDAYLQLHPELVKSYLGQYVAIHAGKLVDWDHNGEKLLQRIMANFPDDIVFQSRVEEVAERELSDHRSYLQ